MPFHIGAGRVKPDNQATISKRIFFCELEPGCFSFRFEFGFRLPFLDNRPKNDLHDLDVERFPLLASRPEEQAITRFEWEQSWDVQRPDHNIKNRIESNKLTPEAHEAKNLFVRLQLDDKLGDELDQDFRNIVVDNYIAHEILEEAMKVLKTAFLEASRAYWPSVWRPIKRGRHLVDISMTAMSDYFRTISDMGLQDALPRTGDLKTLLVQYNKETRNQLAHPQYEYFSTTSEVDIRLQIMQAAILIMGDQERVAKLRDLRDQLAAEMKRVIDKVMDLGRQARNPSFKLWDDDVEFLDDWDARFYNILYEQGRFDGHRLPERDPMLSLWRLYSRQCGDTKKSKVQFGGAPTSCLAARGWVVD